MVSMREDEIIELTLNGLLTNPTGKHSAFMASRARIIDDLEFRYAKLINKHRDFKYKVYKQKNNYLFVFKIPSETLDELFYDVVIMFSPKDKEIEKDRTLNRYTLSLFSNSPAFTFTYTYVLNKNDIIVPLLKGKCNKKALTEPPTVKNPVESYGFEKSCYFACHFIKQNGLSNRFHLDQNLFLFNKDKVLNNIKSDDSKMKEYNLIKSRNKKTKKKTPLGATKRKTTAKRKTNK